MSWGRVGRVGERLQARTQVFSPLPRWLHSHTSIHPSAEVRASVHHILHAITQRVPRARFYFYTVDDKGQLFLEETKHRSIATCLKDKPFLEFFFNNIHPTAAYLRRTLRECPGPEKKDLDLERIAHAGAYPFLSMCGAVEFNFIASYSSPFVFTGLEPAPMATTAAGGHAEVESVPKNGYLVLNNTGGTLRVPFEPETLVVDEEGRVFHPLTTPLGRARARRRSDNNTNSTSSNISDEVTHAARSAPSYRCWGLLESRFMEQLSWHWPSSNDEEVEPQHSLGRAGATTTTATAPAAAAAATHTAPSPRLNFRGRTYSLPLVSARALSPSAIEPAGSASSSTC